MFIPLYEKSQCFSLHVSLDSHSGRTTYLQAVHDIFVFVTNRLMKWKWIILLCSLLFSCQELERKYIFFVLIKRYKPVVRYKNKSVKTYNINCNIFHLPNWQVLTVTHEGAVRRLLQHRWLLVYNKLFWLKLFHHICISVQHPFPFQTTSYVNIDSGIIMCWTLTLVFQISKPLNYFSAWLSLWNSSRLMQAHFLIQTAGSVATRATPVFLQRVNWFSIKVPYKLNDLKQCSYAQRC